MYEELNRVVPMSAECESGGHIEQYPYLLHMHQGAILMSAAYALGSQIDVGSICMRGYMNIG